MVGTSVSGRVAIGVWIGVFARAGVFDRVGVVRSAGGVFDRDGVFRSTGGVFDRPGVSDRVPTPCDAAIAMPWDRGDLLRRELL